MRVTVLGCGAAYARAGGACSGFLVQSDGATVWIDAGNGTLSNLQKHVGYKDIDALVLTHRHWDHIADVTPLMYARAFDEAVEGALAVYAPPDVAPALLAGHAQLAHEMYARVFDFRTLGPQFEVGALRFESFRTVHPVETYGLRVSVNGKTFVYTADSAAFEQLASHCKGADLLICEATYVRDIQADPGIHLWAHETGAVAAGAEPAKLVLTHIWPTIDPLRSVEEAAEVFGGVLEAAIEGDVYEL